MTERIHRPQFTAAVFLSLLSPLIRQLPRSTAAAAGSACWLCAVPAFLLLLLFGAFLTAFLRKEPEGMGALFLRCLGPVVGRVLLVVYGLGFLFYCGFILRVGADRLVVTVYPASGNAVFIVCLLLLSLAAAMGTLRALGRTAVILRATMLAVLGVALLFSFQDVELYNLWPVRTDDVKGVLLGALPLANVGAFAAVFSFLEGYGDPHTLRARSVVPWMAVFCFIALLLCVTVVGSFGAALTQKMSYPFFVMVRDTAVLNLSGRIEAFVIAIWVFSGFTLCTMMLRCAHEALRRAFSLPDPEEQRWRSLKGGRWLFPLEGAASLAAAFLVAGDSLELALWSDRYIPLGSAGFVFVGLPLVWLVGKLRKKI